MCRLPKRKNEEDDEVIEVRDPAHDLTSPALLEEFTTSAEQVAQQLHQFYLNDLKDAHAEGQGRPVSFTELLMGDQFDLASPILDPGYVPQSAAVQKSSTLGDFGSTISDPNAFVNQMFAQMGQP